MMPARLSLPAAICLLLIGCNQGPTLPPMAPVHGTITIDGKPLPRGDVQFVPDTERDTEGPTATAKIQPDGSYSLTTAGATGAMIGWHRVRIVSQQEPRDETDTDPPSLIPIQYTHPQRSGLSYEVREIDENVIDIKLTSTPPR